MSGETPTYAMVEMRGAHSIMRLVPKDISEDSLINYIENDLVREVEKRDLIF